MPGMMDTILNLGLNSKIVKSLEEKMDKRFVYDCYRRLISMYSDVVKGYDKNYYPADASLIELAKESAQKVIKIQRVAVKMMFV